MADNIEITLPSSQGNKDLTTVVRTETVRASRQDFFGTLSLVNNYLWFALGVIAFGIIVYAGFKLVTARGDEKEMKKLGSTLMGLVIGIFIAVFSYLIIRLIINLF